MLAFILNFMSVGDIVSKGYLILKTEAFFKLIPCDLSGAAVINYC